MIRGTVNDRPEPHHRRVYMRTILSEVPINKSKLTYRVPLTLGCAE